MNDAGLNAVPDPEASVDALVAADAPYLIGIRHHSPALSIALPALLEEARPEVLAIELPTEAGPWLQWLAHPDATAPLAMAFHSNSGLAFHPFADFSPELVALRWARSNDVPVVCIDLPVAARPPDIERPSPDSEPSDTSTRSQEPPAEGAKGPIPWLQPGREVFTPEHLWRQALARRARAEEFDLDEVWDRLVEAPAPGSSPQQLRRAALAHGWAARPPEGDVDEYTLLREARMRHCLAGLKGRRVAAVVGAFHAPALLSADFHPSTTAEMAADEQKQKPVPPGEVRHGPHEKPAASGESLPPADEPSSESAGCVVAYSFAQLDSRSGYPAGIRDPEWQQSVLEADGDPEGIAEAATRLVTRIARELRGDGHPAGPAEAAETLRVAKDLAALRGLAAPSRRELVEAITTVLAQGEVLGRGRSMAKAMETVLVGDRQGRVAEGTPASPLREALRAELSAVRLPTSGTETIGIAPLRESDLTKHVLLRRLAVSAIAYAQRESVTSWRGTETIFERWHMAWNAATDASIDLASVKGLTSEQLATTSLLTREPEDPAGHRAWLYDAADCGLDQALQHGLRQVRALPASCAFADAVALSTVLDDIAHARVPGAAHVTRSLRDLAGALAHEFTSAALRELQGIRGSDDLEDARALSGFVAMAARLELGIEHALRGLLTEGSSLMQGAAAGLVGVDGQWPASWLDAPQRRTLRRRLTGLLVTAGHELDSSPALDSLVERVNTVADDHFVAILPALRGAFAVFDAEQRRWLLSDLAHRYGPSGALVLPPEETMAAAAYDQTARGRLAELGLMDYLSESATDIDQPPAEPSPSSAEAPRSPAESSQSPDETPPPPPDNRARIAAPSWSRGKISPDDASSRRFGSQPGQQGRAQPGVGTGAEVAFSPPERWRLILAQQREELSGTGRRLASALDELYGRAHAGSLDESRRRAGDGPSQLGVREWQGEIEALFGDGAVEEIFAEAAEAGRGDVLELLDPGRARPSVELLTTALSLTGAMSEARVAKLRPLVKRLVDQLTAELAIRLRPALTGLRTARPTRRRVGPLDLPRTIRANLRHVVMHDGRPQVVPATPIFRQPAKKSADWHLIVVVDVSGSMSSSVVFSALTAAVLTGVECLEVTFLTFSTEVIDFSGRVADPLALLLEVDIGGGTDIAGALRVARTHVKVPSRTLLVLVSDFEENGPVAPLLGEVDALRASGVHLTGCAALNDQGAGVYNVGIAQQLAGVGMRVAAVTPMELSRWVGRVVRDEH